MDLQQLFALYGIPMKANNKELQGEKIPEIESVDFEEANQSTREGGDGHRKGTFAEILTGKVGGASQPAKTFAEAVSGQDCGLNFEGIEDPAVPLSQAPLPQMEGGNLTITIDEGEYCKGLEQNQYNVIGRLSMRRGEPNLTTLALRRKLEAVWRISKFKVLPMGRGYFQVFLTSMADQSWIMSLGTIDLKPGTFRVSQWVRDFNPELQKQTNAQIWVRIFNLPIEYWRPLNLFSIARAAGLPLKIDKQTLDLDNCLFARILIDADLSNSLPEKVLVKRKELNFFVDLEYEKVPPFCQGCCGIGHTMGMCRRHFTSSTGHNKDWQNNSRMKRSGGDHPEQSFERVSKEGNQDRAAASQVTPISGEPEVIITEVGKNAGTKNKQQTCGEVRMDNAQGVLNSQLQESDPMTLSNTFAILIEQNQDGEAEHIVLDTQFRGREFVNNESKATELSGDKRKNNGVVMEVQKKDKKNNLGKMKSDAMGKLAHKNSEEIRGVTGIPILPKLNHNMVGQTSTIPGVGETQIFNIEKEPMPSDRPNVEPSFLVCQQAINDTLAQGQEQLDLVLNKLNNNITKRGRRPLSTLDKGGGGGHTPTLNEEEMIEFEKRRAKGDAEIERVRARMEASKAQQPKGPQTRSGTKTGFNMGKKK